MLESYDNVIDETKQDGILCYFAEDQYWDKATLKQLRDDHNIVFMTAGDGSTPIMIIPRKNSNPLIALGGEDDGQIFFHTYFGRFENSMDCYWIDSLIADLQEAKRICAEKYGAKYI